MRVEFLDPYLSHARLWRRDWAHLRPWRVLTALVERRDTHKSSYGLWYYEGTDLLLEGAFQGSLGINHRGLQESVEAAREATIRRDAALMKRERDRAVLEERRKADPWKPVVPVPVARANPTKLQLKK